jgi:hypothetical protein
MVGASFPNSSIASILSFVFFTARLRNLTAWGGPYLTSIACLMSLTASAADCTSIPLGCTGTTAKLALIKIALLASLSPAGASTTK